MHNNPKQQNMFREIHLEKRVPKYRCPPRTQSTQCGLTSADSKSKIFYWQQTAVAIPQGCVYDVTD